MDNFVFSLVINGIIGLCLFLYGINSLTTTLETISESKFEQIISKYTNSSFKCFLIGTLLSAITGSSTAVTAISLSLISSKHLSFKKGLIIVIASNIGTSFTSILFNFDFNLVVPFFMLLGTVIYIFSSNQKTKTFAIILLSLSFLFFGLNFLVSNLEKLLTQNELSNILLKLNSSSLIIFVVGIFITALIQSSSAGIGIVQKLTNSCVLTLNAGIAFMLGANIGTTLTGCVASLTGSRDAKKVAFINLLFNLIGSILFMFFLSAFTSIIYIIGKNLNLNYSSMISLSHIIYNFITVILFLLGLKPSKKS